MSDDKMENVEVESGFENDLFFEQDDLNMSLDECAGYDASDSGCSSQNDLERESLLVRPSQKLKITEVRSQKPSTFSGSTSEHLEPRITAALKKLTQNDNMKFMENFDPERSNRERRKLTRKIYTGGRKQMNVYDEKGIHIASGKDLCDCLEESCPGCHFPCPKCHSCKCGHECRQNRKWMYDSIEIEGTDEVIRNKYR